VNNIYVSTKEMASWVVDKHFRNKDLVSVDELLCALEDALDDLEHLQEEFDDYKEYIESNYKEMSWKEQVE